MVGIHLAVIMATFLDPRWITFQNLSHIDEKKQGFSEIQGFGAEEVGRGSHDNHILSQLHVAQKQTRATPPRLEAA